VEHGAIIELAASANDDAAFLDLASRLIARAAIAGDLRDVVVVHINHWFGDRWLGFCGKQFGAVGVRNRRLTGDLTPPPFHPHRVQSARAYQLTDSGVFAYRSDEKWLHRYRPSEANVGRALCTNRLYAWYSGNTKDTEKGVVMVYVIKKPVNAAWYVAFERTPTWHLAQTVGISPRRVLEFIEVAPPATCNR
jgi:hypothetical protein